MKNTRTTKKDKNTTRKTTIVLAIDVLVAIIGAMFFKAFACICRFLYSGEFAETMRAFFKTIDFQTFFEDLSVFIAGVIALIICFALVVAGYTVIKIAVIAFYQNLKKLMR